MLAPCVRIVTLVGEPTEYVFLFFSFRFGHVFFFFNIIFGCPSAEFMVQYWRKNVFHSSLERKRLRSSWNDVIFGATNKMHEIDLSLSNYYASYSNAAAVFSNSYYWLMLVYPNLGHCLCFVSKKYSFSWWRSIKPECVCICTKVIKYISHLCMSRELGQFFFLWINQQIGIVVARQWWENKKKYFHVLFFFYTASAG